MPHPPGNVRLSNSTINDSLLQHVSFEGVRFFNTYDSVQLQKRLLTQHKMLVFISSPNLLINYSSRFTVTCLGWKGSSRPHAPNTPPPLPSHLYLYLGKVVPSGAGCVCVRVCVCERSPVCTSQRKLHADNVSVRVNHRCLFSPHSGLLQTSRGCPPPRLPARSKCSTQVTQGGMTGKPTSIRLWEAAGESKLS